MMLKRLVLLIFGIVLFSNVELLCQTNKNIVYGSEIDGFVIISDDIITFDVFDYFLKGSYKYEKIDNGGLDFIKYENRMSLLLLSNDLIYLFGPNLIYSGIGYKKQRSGRHLDVIISGKEYISSSYLIEGNKQYNANNLSYLKLDNPWAEGVEGSGIGEYIDISWTNEISALFIINGYISYNNPDLYMKNNRIKKIRIYPNESKIGYDFELDDNPNPQTIKLGFDASKIRIEILEVYHGIKWDDTCMSMILGLDADFTQIFFE
jgi:hypothetical protein